MKLRKLYLINSVLFLMMACSESAAPPQKYQDFDDDWQRDNLFGKVKEVAQYKTPLDEKGNPVEAPQLMSVTHYEEFGKVGQMEIYTTPHQIALKIANEYDDLHQMVKSQSQSNNAANQIRTATCNEFDSTGNLISATIVINDTMKMTVSTSYDKQKNPILQCIAKSRDTTNRLISYQYFPDGKLKCKKEMIASANSKQEISTEFQYNKAGQLTEKKTTGLTADIVKTVNSFDSKNSLTKSVHFKNDQMVMTTNYDKRFNPITIQNYERGQLSSEITYDYQFDKRNNWTKRTMHFSEQLSKVAKTTTPEVITRVITYY